MKAALLEDIAKMAVRTVPDPEVLPHQVVLRVKAVGVCGTDLHIFQGHSNYRLDDEGRPIPFSVTPQTLGHEFSGEVVEVGREVSDLKPGDRVLVDQGWNCHSHGRSPLCAYCASGDSHQCKFYQEHGITGLPGAMADYVAVPAINCLKLPEGMSWELAALVEPFGCVLHSNDRVEHSGSRYSFEGKERIRNVLISGAGPAGLLFLQHLRNVRGFAGCVVVSDVRDRNLEIARQFGAATVNVTRQNLTEAVREHTRGDRIRYLIEASGAAAIFSLMPSLLHKQATVLIYGLGHKGGNMELLANVLFNEPTLVSSIGASGGFGPDRRSLTYGRSMEILNSGKVTPQVFVTHRYESLEKIPLAFERDFKQQDYIKGVLSLQ